MESPDGRVSLDGGQLKQLRARAGLSQEALAERCLEQRLCVSIASIKRAETGKTVLYRTARHLASVYEVPVERLWKKPQAEAAHAPAPAPAAPSAAPVAGDENRTVIALQVRLRPPADAGLVAGVEQLVQQFGGRVEAASPLALTAVFGVPRAYRSDSTRSLQCALQAACLLDRSGAELTVRMGEWSGGAFRLASEEAPPTDAAAENGLAPIQVQGDIAAALAEGFEFAPAARRAPWRQLVGWRPPEQGVLSPLVGRYAEVLQFKAIVETTAEYQGGHVVHLRGVAGIGKSRLMAEFRDMARQARFEVHQATVLDFGVEAGGGALGQLTASLLRISLAAAEEEESLAQAFARAGLAPEQQMGLRALLGQPPLPEQAAIYGAMTHATRQERCADALALLLQRAAILNPVAVLVEDVHWGDADLFAILAGMLARTEFAPVVWVLSSRPENDPLEQLVRQRDAEQPVTVLGLAPLRRTEAEALALQFDRAAPEYRAQCVERARGNALFLTQMLLSSQDRVVPDSLKHLVQGQLDRLAPPDRRALRAAAAIGQRFSLALLRELLANPGYQLDAAVAAHLVRPVEAGSYLFVHDLVMQCIHEAMAQPQRDALHQALGRLYRDRDLSLGARHLHRARDAQAPATLLAAAREKVASYHYEAALELVELARGITYAPIDAHALALLGAEAALKTGRTQQARQGFEEALSLATTPPARLDAVLGLARTLNLLEELEAEGQLLEAALPVARAAGAEAALAQLLYLQGNMYFPRGDFATSRQHHAQALVHARSCGDRRTQAQALSGLGDSYYAEGRMQQAHAVFDDCLALCRADGFADVEASNRFMLATTAIYLGRGELALADALAAADLGLRVGNRRAEIVSRLTASWVLAAFGRAGEARAQVAQALEVVHTLQAARFEPFLLEALARAALVEGHTDEAREHVTRAWALVQERKLERFIGPWVLGTLALVSQEKTQERAQEEALARGSALLAAGCVAHNGYRFLVAAAECALLRQRMDQALEFAQRLEQFVQAEPCAWSEHHAALVRGVVAWAAAPDEAQHRRVAAQLAAGRQSGFAFTMPLLQRSLGGAA